MWWGPSESASADRRACQEAPYHSRHVQSRGVAIHQHAAGECPCLEPRQPASAACCGQHAAMQALSTARAACMQQRSPLHVPAVMYVPLPPPLPPSWGTCSCLTPPGPPAGGAQAGRGALQRGTGGHPLMTEAPICCTQIPWVHCNRLPPAAGAPIARPLPLYSILVLDDTTTCGRSNALRCGPAVPCPMAPTCCPCISSCTSATACEPCLRICVTLGSITSGSSAAGSMATTCLQRRAALVSLTAVYTVTRTDGQALCMRYMMDVRVAPSASD